MTLKDGHLEIWQDRTSGYLRPSWDLQKVNLTFLTEAYQVQLFSYEKSDSTWTEHELNMDLLEFSITLRDEF